MLNTYTYFENAMRINNFWLVTNKQAGYKIYTTYDDWEAAAEHLLANILVQMVSFSINKHQKSTLTLRNFKFS